MLEIAGQLEWTVPDFLSKGNSVEGSMSGAERDADSNIFQRSPWQHPRNLNMTRTCLADLDESGAKICQNLHQPLRSFRRIGLELNKKGGKENTWIFGCRILMRKDRRASLLAKGHGVGATPALSLASGKIVRKPRARRTARKTNRTKKNNREEEHRATEMKENNDGGEQHKENRK